MATFHLVRRLTGGLAVIIGLVLFVTWLQINESAFPKELEISTVPAESIFMLLYMICAGVALGTMLLNTYGKPFEYAGLLFWVITVILTPHGGERAITYNDWLTYLMTFGWPIILFLDCIFVRQKIVAS